MDLGALVGIAVVVAIAVGVAVLWIRVGMLVAPRVERWGAPRDPETEDTAADDRP